MVNPIMLAVGAIGAVLLLSNIDKIKGLLPSASAETPSEVSTQIKEGDTTINLPPQDSTKQDTERQIIIIQTGAPTAPTPLPPAPTDTTPRVSDPNPNLVTFGKSEQDIAILEDFFERQAAREQIEINIRPEDKFSTSLAESQFIIREQIKRDDGFEGSSITNFQITDASSTFQQTLKAEQERAARLFQQLFGSVQNPDF